MLAYGLAFASAIWLLGGCLLVALPSISVQLRYWPAILTAAALQGSLVMYLSYWSLYHNSPVLEDRHPGTLTYAFLGFLGVASSLSALIYLILLRRFYPGQGSREERVD